MTQLSVNLNKVAWVRNTRPLNIPNVVQSAYYAIEAGAHGITVHPRPDERHIRKQDVYDLAEAIGVEFNIEGNPFPAFMELMAVVRPTQCTLVPDSPDQSTSDHGWDVLTEGERLRPLIGQLHEYGCRVSLFLDPVVEQVEAAKEVGADRIELYTEPYATAFEEGRHRAILPAYVAAAERAHALGLGINAGHDLNQANLGPFLDLVPHVLEVSIGHALIADALFDGLGATVAAYRGVLAVSVKAAEVKDAERVRRLTLNWLETYGGRSANEDEFLAGLEDWLRAGEGTLFVALREASIIGAACAEPQDDGSVLVKYLAAAHAEEAWTLATRLLHRVAYDARERGATILRAAAPLRCVSVVRACEDFGFQPEATEEGMIAFSMVLS